MEPLGTFESRLPLKAIIVALVAIAAIFWAVGCAPPTAQEFRLHGRPAWDAWVADNVTTVDADLLESGRCGLYSSGTRTAYIDRQCMQDWASNTPGADVFIVEHEHGHGADVALGFTQGVTPQGLERAAQCIAEVVLGYSFSPAADDPAYWDCPDAEVERTRQLMIDGGMW